MAKAAPRPPETDTEALKASTSADSVASLSASTVTAPWVVTVLVSNSACTLPASTFTASAPPPLSVKALSPPAATETAALMAPAS